VGGPQVDPGYIGHLYCPIYNLSDKEVALHIGEPIAVIDFVKTTLFDKTKSQHELVRYPHPPKRVVMEDYGIDDLRSALFTKARERLVEFEEEIRDQRQRFNTYTQISFVMFALMISLIAIISRANAENLSLGAAFLGAGTIAISVAALLIALFSYVGRRVGRLVYELYGRIMGTRARDAMRFVRNAWWVGIITSVLFAIGGGYAVYSQVEPIFRDLRQQRVLTKSDLNELSKSITADIGQLSTRVAHIEQSPTATVEDLENLEASLEREIQAMKSRGK
jgi:uncharacterized membrane protein (DUF485 family)